MKTKIKIRLIRILAITLAVSLTYYLAAPNFLNNGEVQAVGDLDVTWGVPDGDPIFVVNNMAPGDIETRSVDVTNNAASPRDVGVRGIETSEVGNISTVLDIVISEGATDLYGGTAGAKTLDQFFADSAGPDGVPLSTLTASASTTYTFTVTFDPSEGNEFQNTQVIFDLIIGISIDLPDECDNLTLLGTPIIGTSKAETLTGTPGNDLILGLEGADRINGNGGDDCIFGGTGADRINGNNGKDVIFGEAGGDNINGNADNDLVFGGTGGDTIKGENGQDHLVGNEGGDNIDGGNDDDTLEGNASADSLNGGNGIDHLIGGDAPDSLKGGNDKDLLEGNAGADSLKGEGGNDTLIGGAGVDNANGGPNTDSCDAETEIDCEP